MNAIDRYLRQVGRWILPIRRREVMTRIREDLEEFVGEEGDELLVARKLREFGHPPVVAARYVNYPDVIPGMLAPAYFLVLTVTVATLFLVRLTLLIPGAIRGDAWLDNLAQAFTASFAAVPWAFTVITIVFALLGYWAQRQAVHPRS